MIRVDNGIIPAIDTGSKTWRYRIAIEDVVAYLEKREKYGSMIPNGAVTSRKDVQHRFSFSQIVEPGQEQTVAEYFSHICVSYPDVLTTEDISMIVGLHKKSIMRIVKDGYIRYIAVSPKYLIPKVYLLEFVASRRFIDLMSNSDDFIQILDCFKKWRNR